MTTCVMVAVALGYNWWAWHCIYPYTLLSSRGVRFEGCYSRGSVMYSADIYVPNTQGSLLPIWPVIQLYYAVYSPSPSPLKHVHVFIQPTVLYKELFTQTVVKTTTTLPIMT